MQSDSRRSAGRKRKDAIMGGDLGQAWFVHDKDDSAVASQFAAAAFAYSIMDSIEKKSQSRQAANRSSRTSLEMCTKSGFGGMQIDR